MGQISERMTSPLQPPGRFEEIPRKGIETNPGLIAEHQRLRKESGDAATLRQMQQPGYNPSNSIPPINSLIGGQQSDIPKPYSYQAYPSKRYHPTKAPDGVQVMNPDHEDQIAPSDGGWVKSPALFPPSTTPAMDLQGKLELLEALTEALAIVGEPEDQSPYQTLQRIIAERDDFARKATKAMKGKKEE